MPPRSTAGWASWASCRTSAAAAGSSGADCATSGWRRAPVGSRARATAAPSSRGSSRPRATIRTRTSMCATTVRPGAAPGTRVTVPLATERLPAEGRLRTLVAQLVQLRPVLEDPARELWLELPSGAVELARVPRRSPIPSGRCCSTTRSRSTGGVRARVTVRRSARPLSPGMSRATRVGGLVVRSGRAAHESTFASPRGLARARAACTARCAATRSSDLQRDALERPRPQVVVRVDRSGLNDNHPVVKALYAVDRPRPAPDRRGRGAAGAGAPRPRRGGALRARDQVGLRALNDALQGRVRRARQGRLRRPAARRARTSRSSRRAHPRASSARGRDSAGDDRRAPRRARRCASSSRCSACIPASGAASRC